MKQCGIRVWGSERVKLGMVSMCIFGLLAGCSSQLRTTVVSGSEVQEVQVTQLAPETVTVEEVVAPLTRKETPMVQKTTPMDIPVEEPARPTLRREVVAEDLPIPSTTGTESLASTTGSLEEKKVASLGQTSIPMDIPVEEPARPVLRPGVTAENLTTLSTTEAKTVASNALETEAGKEVASLGQGNLLMDIPVEEPTRPTLRREVPVEIFATPKTSGVSSETESFSESPISVPSEEFVAPSRSSLIEPSRQMVPEGIPPISLEPEMPALPQVGENEGIEASQADEQLDNSQVAETLTPDSPRTETPAVQEPIQVAKIVPEEQAEVITEILEATLNDIYFDYDRFAIRDDAVPVLKANADLLAEKFGDSKIVIEGHCDERGTQSYNMVLGEARANAVKSYLEDLGIPGDKFEVVTYGKDRPFCREQTEECWQKNRRGHFVIE